MPLAGIFGAFLRKEGKRVDPGVMSRMGRALDGSSSDAEETRWDAGDDRCRVGAVRRARMRGLAGTHASPNAVLAFHGSLDGLEALTGDPAARSRPAEHLLRLYELEGARFVRKLRGTFSIAVWDRSRGTLELVCDRFRIQPLLYYEDPDHLVFATTMAAILASGLASRRSIDPTSLIDVVTSSYVPTPRTIFREVRKLPPGHILLCDAGQIRVEPYWDLSFLDPDTATERDLASRLRERFSESLSLALASEPDPDRIGTFLSGGVDSTAVTGLLTRLGRRPIRAFSIGFSDDRFNELGYARIAARAFGAEHHEYFVTPKDTLEVLPILVDAFDEPYANASAVPTYYCARLAREHGVEALYAGDGGDELFAGNPWYASERVYDRFRWVPRPVLLRILFPAVSAAARGSEKGFFAKGKRFLERVAASYPERLRSYGLLRYHPLEALFTPEFLETLERPYVPFEMAERHYRRAPARTELDRQLYVDLKLAIADNDLFKVTRMTAANGITARFPFLDLPLAEFAARIPSRVKMRGGRLRSFFKEAYSDLLPRETREKKKHGFGAPIAVWLRTDPALRDLKRELVLSPGSGLRDYLREDGLRNLVSAHESDSTSFYGAALWNLMMLELWRRRHA